MTFDESWFDEASGQEAVLLTCIQAAIALQQETCQEEASYDYTSFCDGVCSLVFDYYQEEMPGVYKLIRDELSNGDYFDVQSYVEDHGTVTAGVLYAVCHHVFYDDDGNEKYFIKLNSIQREAFEEIVNNTKISQDNDNSPNDNTGSNPQMILEENLNPANKSDSSTAQSHISNNKKTLAIVCGIIASVILILLVVSMTAATPSIVINQDEPVEMIKGNERDLPVDYVNCNTEGRKYTLESSDEKIIKAKSNGKIKAVGIGEATITAYDNEDNSISGTVSIEVTPKPKKIKNGKFYKKPNDECIAPLTVHAGEDTSSFVFFDSKGKSNDFSFTVKAGKRVTCDVPLGTYKMYYASGEVWYGPKYKFGKDTVYTRLEDKLKFYVKGDTANGHELTLYTEAGGNMDTEEISNQEFPE